MPGQYSLAEAAPVPSAPAPGGGRGAYRLEDATPPPVARESASDAISGFLQGIKDTFAGIPGAVTHPLNAIADTFAASKDQYRKAVAAAGPAGDNKGDLFGFAAHTLGMFPLLGPPMAEFLTDKDADAHEQARKLGQIVAIKTLVPKAAEMAAGAPELPANVMRMADAVKAGARAAGPDVAAGIAKVGAGELLAQVPGMEFPARIGIAYPGTRQIARGIGKGFSAAEQAGKPPVPVAAEAVPANLELLDAIAKHLDYKDYAAAIKNPDAKIIIDNLAKAGETAPVTAPVPQIAPTLSAPVQPLAAPVPAPAPPVAPPKPIQTFVPGRPLRAPLALPVSPGAAIPPVATVEPVAAPPASPVPQAAPVAVNPKIELLKRQLADEMLKSGSASPEMLEPPVPEPPVSAAGAKALATAMRDQPPGAPRAIADAAYAGKIEPEVANAVYEAAGRAAKAQHLSTMLYDEGLKASQVAKWNDAQWDKAAADRGLPVFSKASQTEVLKALRIMGKRSVTIGEMMK